MEDSLSRAMASHERLHLRGFRKTQPVHGSALYGPWLRGGWGA